MTGLVSTIVEAWQELRINKVRILLALLGVALSVAALTSVVGVGNLAREGYKYQSERNGGRVATLSLNVGGPTTPDPAKLEKAYQGIQQRYGITTSTHVGQTQAGFQFPRGVTSVNVTIVDAGYGIIHPRPASAGQLVRIRRRPTACARRRGFRSFLQPSRPAQPVCEPHGEDPG